MDTNNKLKPGIKKSKDYKKYIFYLIGGADNDNDIEE